MLKESAIIMLILMAYGFWRNRKWLKEWSKDFWIQLKIAWDGGRDGRR